MRERPTPHPLRTLGLVIRYGCELDSDNCWRWDEAPFNGPVSEQGYGYVVSSRGRRVGAHRLAFQWANDCHVPPQCEVDHLCRIRACVNPAHLQAVDAYGNTARQALTPEQHRGLGAPPQESDP